MLYLVEVESPWVLENNFIPIAMMMKSTQSS